MYPIKYLNALLLPFKSYLDSTILLISALLIVIGFLYLRNAFLLIYSSPGIKTLSYLFYFLCYVKKKKSKVFNFWFFGIAIIF